jgi:hypothetical protein
MDLKRAQHNTYTHKHVACSPNREVLVKSCMGTATFQHSKQESSSLVVVMLQTRRANIAFNALALQCIVQLFHVAQAEL